MRLVLSLLFLTLAPAAWAQEVVYATGEVASLRFPDATVVGPTFSKDARLTVLFRQGERIRVTNGDVYGWIPATSVTTEAPAIGADIEEWLQQFGGDLGVTPAPPPAAGAGAPE